MADGPLTPEDQAQYEELRADFLEDARAILRRLDELRKSLSRSPDRADALAVEDWEPKP